MKRTLVFALSTISLSTLLAQDDHSRNGFGAPGQPMRPSPLFVVLDVNGDGVISAAELKNAPASLRTLDKNGDGQLTAAEVRPNFRPDGNRPEQENRAAPSANGEDVVQTLLSFDRNGDGKLSKEEVPERMQGLFDRGDTNHDGVLTKDEIRALAQQQQNAASTAHPGEGRGPDFTRFDPLFQALDTNHDGSIAAEEMANATASLQKLDKNGDGQLTPDEVRANRGRGGDPSVMARRMIEEFDQNGDGKLSKAELPDRMQTMFERIDADHDGFVTADELVRFLQTQNGPFLRPGGDRPGEPH